MHLVGFYCKKAVTVCSFYCMSLPKSFVSNNCHSLVSSCGNYMHMFWVYIQKSGRGGASDLILMEVSQVCSIRDSWNLQKGNLIMIPTVTENVFAVHLCWETTESGDECLRKLVSILMRYWNLRFNVFSLR